MDAETAALQAIRPTIDNGLFAVILFMNDDSFLAASIHS